MEVLGDMKIQELDGTTGYGIIEFGGRRFELQRYDDPCNCSFRKGPMSVAKIRSISHLGRDSFQKIVLLTCGHARWEDENGNPSSNFSPPPPKRK